jgi:hypothetical protein
MKKVAFVLFALMVSIPMLRAQEEETFKPVEGDWGILLNINGLINNIKLSNTTSPINTSLITGKYYLSDTKVLRVDFGPSIKTVKNSREDSIGANLRGIDSTYKKSSIYLAMGLEKHFSGTKRLDPYIAGQIGLGFIGKTKIEQETREVSSLGTDRETITYERDGGFALGLIATAGFNYFVAKNFALGAEYSFGYNYLKDGGNFSRVTRTEPISGSPSSIVEKGKNQVNTNSFVAEGNARILLSYYF